MVNGKWFIPALFLGFLGFTIAMCWGTVYLGKNLRPKLEKYEIAREKERMEQEMRSRKPGEVPPATANSSPKR